MSLDFDPSNDLPRVADGTESVTLRRRGSTPGSPGTTIDGALRGTGATGEAVVGNRHEIRRRADSDGRLLAGDLVWHLPAERLADPPQPGDVVLDGSGVRWTILEAQSVTLQTRWRVKTRNLAVAHGLDDTVTILKATYAKTAAGAAEPTWHVWRTGVRARIQAQGTTMGTEHRSRRTATRYRIFLDEDLALDHTHRVEGPDGTAYRILGTSGAERLGEPQTIEAEVVS